MIQILVNELRPDGMRRVKVVCDDPHPLPFPLKGGRELELHEWDDEALGLHYVEATWPCMGVVDVQLEGMPKFRRLVVWKFMPGERVSEVIRCVADWYFVQTHQRPGYAFLRSLPSGAENGQEVEGVMLMQAEWALPGCVMIGG